MPTQKTTPKKATSPKPTPRKTKCNAPGCDRKPARSGLCDSHYDTRRDLADRPQKG